MGSGIAAAIGLIVTLAMGVMGFFLGVVVGVFLVSAFTPLSDSNSGWVVLLGVVGFILGVGAGIDMAKEIGE
jgi:hypothetical protein